MRSIKLLISTIVLIVTLTSSSFAQSLKTIQLTDGSTLKGKVLSLEDGVYTIATKNLGTIEVYEEEIISIGKNTNNSQTKNQQPSINNNQLLQSQMQQMQMMMMNDPGLLEDIQELAQDPEFLQILQDPSFMQAINQKDPQQLQGNASAEQLLKNPKIKELINKINSQMSQ